MRPAVLRLTTEPNVVLQSRRRKRVAEAPFSSKLPGNKPKLFLCSRSGLRARSPRTGRAPPSLLRPGPPAAAPPPVTGQRRARRPRSRRTGAFPAPTGPLADVGAHEPLPPALEVWDLFWWGGVF